MVTGHPVLKVYSPPPSPSPKKEIWLFRGQKLKIPCWAKLLYFTSKISGQNWILGGEHDLVTPISTLANNN